MTEKQNEGPKTSPEDIKKEISIIRSKKELTKGDRLLMEVLNELENDIRGKLRPRLEKAIEQTEGEEGIKTLEAILDVLNRDPEEALRLVKALNLPHEIYKEEKK